MFLACTSQTLPACLSLANQMEGGKLARIGSSRCLYVHNNSAWILFFTDNAFGANMLNYPASEGEDEFEI